jgi:hypothetical protein
MVKALLLISCAISAVSLSSPVVQMARKTVHTEAEMAINAHGILMTKKPGQPDEQSQEEPVAQPPVLVAASVDDAAKDPSADSDGGKSGGQSDSVKGALHKGMLGGLAGIGAGIVQVMCLNWLKTAMNWQYYHGGSLKDAFRSLWLEGGIGRFYQGAGFAFVQVPVAHFGSTFVQAGIVGLVSSSGHIVHGMQATMLVAIMGAFWRILIAPLDTLKTTWQVHGTSAKKMFDRRLHVSGPSELWSGASALFFCQLMAKLPWWGVYNIIMQSWSQPSSPAMSMLRNGIAGMLAQMASDVATNSIRVLKVRRQATVEGQGYAADAEEIVNEEGVMGLFLRGLSGRIILGSLNGALFAVLWNLIMGAMNHEVWALPEAPAGAPAHAIVRSAATHP